MIGLQRLTSVVLSRNFNFSAHHSMSSISNISNNHVRNNVTVAGGNKDINESQLEQDKDRYSDDMKTKSETTTTAKAKQIELKDEVHPYALHEDPESIRPFGSNSEQAVAADRSSVDPLSNSKKSKNNPRSLKNKEKMKKGKK